MKTKLLFYAVQKFKNGIKFNSILSFLIIFFMTVSSFGQTDGITFTCVGSGDITFEAPDGNFNGKVSWSNGKDPGTDPVNGPFWTLRFELDNTWSLREPGAGTPGPRFFYSNVISDLPSCNSADWIAELNGLFCSSIQITCTSPPDPDNDGDGFPASVDCNDNDATVNAEQEYFVDADFDGFGSTTTAFVCASSPPAGYSSNSVDCDDMESTVYPGAPEVCDGLDNDCDDPELPEEERIDEGIVGCIDGVIIEYCDDKQKKVLICHNDKTICVSINALDAHLAHGDYLGTCGSTKVVEEDIAEEVPTSYDAVSWPNPSNDSFNVRMTTPNTNDKVSLKAFDINGRLVHSNKINGNEDYQFGSQLTTGVYFVRLSQANTVKVIKLIKQ